MSILIWLAIFMLAILANQLWLRNNGAFSARLARASPQAKVTGGLIAMGVCGLLLVSSASAFIGVRLPGLTPAWDGLTLIRVPLQAFLAGLGYGIYRLGKAEHLAAAPLATVGRSEGGTGVPQDAGALATQRFSASMAMAVAVMIAGTTGLCTVALVSYGASMRGGLLPTLAIGLPAPAIGVAMVRRASRRLHEISPSVESAGAPPTGDLQPPATDLRYVAGIATVVWGSAALLSKLSDLILMQHSPWYLNDVRGPTDLLAPLALMVGVWLLRSRQASSTVAAAQPSDSRGSAGAADAGGSALDAAAYDTEEQQTLRRRNLAASAMFSLAGVGLLLATMIEVFSDDYPSLRQVGQWAFQIVLGAGVLGLGLWLMPQRQARPPNIPGRAVTSGDASNSQPSPAPDQAADGPAVRGAASTEGFAAVSGEAVRSKWFSIAMVLVGGMLVLAGGAFATIGTPVVFQQMFWGGGPLYEAHRVATLAIAWAVPVFGVVLVRRGLRHLRRRGSGR